MAINFPNSPQAGDPHSEAGIDWVYDGEKWVAQSEATFWARTNSTLSPSTAGDNISTTGDLIAGCTTTGTSGSSGEAKVVGYQQGAWTPGVVSTVNMGSTISASTCSWARVGNKVTIWYNFSPGDPSGSTQVADQFIVNGMPYNIDQTFTNSSPSLGNQSGGRTDNAQWWGAAFWNSGDAETQLTLRAFNLVGTTTRNTPLRGQFCYITDDTTWAPANGATIS